MKIKSVIAVFMLVACIFTLLPTSVSADEETIKTITTGDLSLQEPTKEQIVAAMDTVTKYTSVFETEPSVQAPYATGKLDEHFLQNGVDYLNYIRYITHLPQVQLSDELNEKAQYGAVLLAANNELSHYPTKPADMEESFYKKGYETTTTSNLGMGYYNLTAHILGCMEDDSSNSNLSVVGHRRWLLSSRLKYVGFGFAKGQYPYSATKVFDRSGASINYDAIAWPASGNMPQAVFASTVPWSVTINRTRYEMDKKRDIRITVTSEVTGETWIFDNTTANAPNGENAYFLVDSQGFGDGSYGDFTFIFRPDLSDVDAYRGVYTVTISGLEDRKNDDDVTLVYNVDFFDAVSTEGPVIEEQPENQMVPMGSKATVGVEASGTGLSFEWFIKVPGSKDFYSFTTLQRWNMTVTEQFSGCQVYCVITDKNGKSVTTDTITITGYQQAVILTQPQDVTAGTNAPAQMEVIAEGDGLTYDWFIKKTSDTAFVRANCQNSVFTITMSQAYDGAEAYCIVKDAYGTTLQTETAKFTYQIAILASGTCGNGVSWELLDTGELIIQGNGDMDDYDAASDAPWKNYASKIKKITVEEGVTSVGAYAFCDNPFCEEITLPAGLHEIHEYAFCDDTNLKTLTLHDTKTAIKRGAFKGCSHLTDVYFDGSELQWEELEIGDDNGPLENSEHHCAKVAGDLDGNDIVDNRDVEYLLWYTLFPDDYLLTGGADFDGDGVVDNKDVEYLLWYTLFPEEYPL